MSLKPWREIARPHDDVLKGTTKQSEFAADISQVAGGIASEEYQNPVKFFARTFITEGMSLLLSSVAQRLAGQGGDPVIQLQTSFGGGKTHTMLAVYHLASREVATSELHGVPPILDAAGIVDLPTANVAVLDGLKMSPSQPAVHGSLAVNTLWGELAYQLMGEEGYALVADSDRDGTSPGKDALIKLLTQAAPCVILIDELQKYFAQFAAGSTFRGGTFESNIAFVQALTEALKSVPKAILLASLPESEAEIGSTAGEKALTALEKHFGRVESVWKPVATNEAFEIVRRRLFADAGSRAEVEGIARQFHDFYRKHSEQFPLETQSNEYFERLCQSYPIHPEIFDRLYQDWTTLDKFQRTRGVLQYMAVVIHRLWVNNNQDALIMPGSLPLGDPDVRTKSTHYLPAGWEPVIEKDIDGQYSNPVDIDTHNSIFGSVQAATRTCRTIFLGSAPAAANQVVRGIELERILLGSVQPGQTIGHFTDALKRLHDKLQHLYQDQDRHWFDTKPNLRREMESHKQKIKDDQLEPLIRKSVGNIFARSTIFSGGTHIFTPSKDVQDNWEIRLVVLAPAFGFSRTDPSAAYQQAEEILTRHGEKNRLRKNRLFFFAADSDVVGRLKECGRIYLAWKDIVDDIRAEKLNLDLFQAKIAEKNCAAAEETFKQVIRQTYKWLICPTEIVPADGNPKGKVEWEAVAVPPGSLNVTAAIETIMIDEQWVIREWSPIHLRNMLDRWYFKNGKADVGIQKVWEDCSINLYLPRLLNDHVLKDTVTAGVASKDFFGYAAAKENDKYSGFSFGERAFITIDEHAVLIQKDVANAFWDQLEEQRRKEQQAREGSSADGTGGITGGTEETGGTEDGGGTLADTTSTPATTTASAVKTRFYADVKLNPTAAKMAFGDIMDEVIQQFLNNGDNIEISIDISVQSATTDGFSENVQRGVKENCNTLGFDSFEFEAD